MACSCGRQGYAPERRFAQVERALAAFAQGVRPQYTQSVINIPHFRSQLLLVITQDLLSIERNVAWLPAVIIPEYGH